MIIEVFKTNVCEPADASRLVSLLSGHIPGSKVNFDLLDCDKILRVEAPEIYPEKIISTLHEKGFFCALLE